MGLALPEMEFIAAITDVVASPRRPLVSHRTILPTGPVKMRMGMTS